MLGPGVPGELQVRGRAVMTEYYKKPAETAAAFTEDGWFRTGDAAMWLPDGHLRFLGRYKDMLKVGGENVDPMETEALLLEHPAVQQVAVVGLPTNAWARWPWPMSRAGRAPRSTPTRCSATAAARSQASSCRGTWCSSTSFR